MKFDYAILCDQVRREDNGKIFIIGVYASDIQVPSIPSTVLLSLLLWFSGPTKPMKLDMKAELNSKEIISGSVDLHAVQSNRSATVFSNIPLHVPELGILEFSIFWDEKWTNVWSGEVGLNNQITN